MVLATWAANCLSVDSKFTFTNKLNRTGSIDNCLVNLDNTALAKESSSHCLGILSE